MERSLDMTSEYIENYMLKLCDGMKDQYVINPRYLNDANLKRGLRNADGTGVLVGVTGVGSVQGYIVEDGIRVPKEGRLYYRGISMEDIVEAHRKDDTFGFEEVAYLLIAGKLPTASAVVGDIIDAVKHKGRALSISWDECYDEDYVVPYKSDEVSMFIRLKAENADELKPYLSELFGKLIHIERKGRPDDEIAFITPSYIEYDLDSKLEELSRYAIIKSKIRLL